MRRIVMITLMCVLAIAVLSAPASAVTKYKTEAGVGKVLQQGINHHKSKVTV